MKKVVPRKREVWYTGVVGKGREKEMAHIAYPTWGVAELRSVGTIDEIVARRDSLLAQWNELFNESDCHIR